MHLIHCVFSDCKDLVFEHPFFCLRPDYIFLIMMIAHTFFWSDRDWAIPPNVCGNDRLMIVVPTINRQQVLSEFAFCHLDTTVGDFLQ